MSWRSRKNGRHCHHHALTLRARERQLEVAREVIIVAQLEAMLAGLDGDPAAQRAERRDQPTVDVDLRIADAALDVDDRVGRGHAVRPRPGATRRGEPARDRERADHGAPDSVASTTSPTTLTATWASAVGGFFTIDAIR